MYIYETIIAQFIYPVTLLVWLIAYAHMDKEMYASIKNSIFL